jgi:hypothetical protein
MVDKWKTNSQSTDLPIHQLPISNLVLAAFFLGIATSIRILGPLSAILVILYAWVQKIKFIEST